MKLFSLQKEWLKLQQKSFMTLTPQTIFSTFHFCLNLWMDLISKIVCSKQAFLTLCNVTLSLIGLIHKLQRKWSVVNTATGVNVVKHFQNNFSNFLQARSFQSIQKKLLSIVKLSSLQKEWLKLQQKSFMTLTPQTVFSTFHFCLNLWMDLISKIVCSKQAFLTLCYVTL
jgi:hypothetical protein